MQGPGPRTSDQDQGPGPWTRDTDHAGDHGDQDQDQGPGPGTRDTDHAGDQGPGAAGTRDHAGPGMKVAANLGPGVARTRDQDPLHVLFHFRRLRRTCRYAGRLDSKGEAIGLGLRSLYLTRTFAQLLDLCVSSSLYRSTGFLECSDQGFKIRCSTSNLQNPMFKIEVSELKSATSAEKRPYQSYIWYVLTIYLPVLTSSYQFLPILTIFLPCNGVLKL